MNITSLKVVSSRIMATFDQLKELFKYQEDKEAKRREKEKEEEERKRKEDKQDVKEVIRSHMFSIKEDIKEIKNNAVREQDGGKVQWHGRKVWKP